MKARLLGARTWVVVFACLNATACIRSLDGGKVKCTSTEHCPSDYVCNAGKCISRSTVTADGGNPGMDSGVPVTDAKTAGVDTAELGTDVAQSGFDAPEATLDGASGTDGTIDVVVDDSRVPVVDAETSVGGDGADLAADVPATPDVPLAPEVGPEVSGSEAGPEVSKLGNGATCASGTECTSGNCVGSRCCVSSSCPLCQECTGNAGTCTAIAGSDGKSCGANMYCQNGDCGTCTPGVNCSTGNLCEIGSTSCATGRATCVKSASNTGALCSAQSCSANLQKSAAYCTSSGTCLTAATTTCAYGCNGNVCQTLKPNGSVCAASSECQSGGCRFDSASGNYICTNCGTLNALCCMNYDECSGGYYCDSQTSCKAQKALGDSCSSSGQCLSGYCSMAGYCVSSCGLKGDGCCAGGNCSTSALYCVQPTGAGWYCLPCGVSGSFCCVSPAQACETGLTCNTNTSTCN